MRHLESDAFVWQTKLEKGDFRKVPLLALGDSQIMAALRGPAGGGFYNMGLPSAQATSLIAILERSQAKTVIINVSPYMFFKSPVTATHERLRIQQLQPFLHTLALRTPPQMMAEAVYFLPLMKARPSVQHCFLRSRCSAYRERAMFNAQTLFLLEQNQGQWVWQSTGEDCQTLPQPSQPLLLRADLQKGALDDWQKLSHLAREKNSKVFLVKIPFSPTFMELGGQALSSSLDETLRAAPFSGFFAEGVLSPPEGLLQAEHFRDLTHVNSCGAKIYSDWLWKSLERR